MYASGETARHRDRLRPEMLSARGWNLHRVWALDWARDPKAALAGIEAALVRARNAGAPGKATARRSRSSAKAEAAASEADTSVAA